MNLIAIYVLWLRELKRLFRSKSRLVSSFVTPFLFLIALGFGFGNSNISGMPSNVSYLSYLIPGVVGMSLMNSSLMSGLSILFDKEFGFLKEIMVAPVSRYSIILGRILGNVSTSMIQSLLIFFTSLFLGLEVPSLPSLLLVLLIMVLTSFTFVGLGILLTTVIKDMQGFGSIISLIMMPLMFLSGAFYPLDNFPLIMKILAYVNPLTYGVDAMRSVLINTSTFNPFLDTSVLLTLSILFLIMGAVRFEHAESV